MAELIETDNSGNAYAPQIAVDGLGNAVAVWHQHDGSWYSIWANRYVVGAGWGVTELIETDNSGNAYSPEVAVDGLGNAVAVWYQHDGDLWNIWANRYVVGTGWGVAELIETDSSGSASGPDVAVDTSGNAVAVWYQTDGTRYNIWANRYVAGIGWVGAELIETDNAGDAWGPEVAADSLGNAIAVWYQHDGTRHNIWANRYVVGTGWAGAGLIETDNSGSADSPEVAVDGLGNAVAVWRHNDGTRYNVQANRYVVGTGWIGAELVETDDSGSVIDLAVAVDASGNAATAWQQSDGIRYNIWANRYVVGTGWKVAELIETDNSGNAYGPQVAVDVAGNTVVVWNQWYGAQYNIWANQYVVGIGWVGANLIETNNAGDASDPAVAVDGLGNAVAVWHQDDGTRNNIWANRYVAPDITPPSLTLSNPIDGITTDEPVIMVSGMTEPGATVSVNGMLAVVLSDGSFSCTIILKQGSNTIMVTAADDSGNSATLSRIVVYDDPLLYLMDDLSKTNDELRRVRSQNLLLVAALIAVGTLAVVSLVMYFRLRKMMSSPDMPPVRTEPPPPPA